MVEKKMQDVMTKAVATAQRTLERAGKKDMQEAKSIRKRNPLAR
jgi:hypothetical protein